MAVKKTYRINLRNYGSPPAVMVSQYDEGYAIAFEIFDGPLPVMASSLSGYTFKLKGRQPGNPPFLAYEFEGTLATALNAVVSFEIDTTMTGRAGKGTAELVILDEENDVKFASVNFAVYTEPAAVPDGSIDADVQRAMEIAEEVQEIVDTAAAEVKGEAEAWAVGQRDGEDVPSTDPTYENNAKYYAEQAQDIADSIGIDATLSVSGKAADAKKTGDEISSLKEDLTAQVGDALPSVNMSISYTYNGYVKRTDGGLSSSSNWRAKGTFSSLKTTTKWLRYSCPTAASTATTVLGAVASLAFYSAATVDSFISAAPLKVASGYGLVDAMVEVPSGAKYIRYSCHKDYVNSFYISELSDIEKIVDNEDVQIFTRINHSNEAYGIGADSMLIKLKRSAFTLGVTNNKTNPTNAWQATWNAYYWLMNHPSAMFATNCNFSGGVTAQEVEKHHYPLRYAGVDYPEGEEGQPMVGGGQHTRPYLAIDTAAQEVHYYPIDTDPTTIPSNYNFAFACGNLLLSNGNVVAGVSEDYIDSTDRNPRNVFGWDDDHFYIWFCEGRNDRNGGYKFPEIVSRLQSYGVTNAVNLDGGGSVCVCANVPNSVKINEYVDAIKIRPTTLNLNYTYKGDNRLMGQSAKAAIMAYIAQVFKPVKADMLRVLSTVYNDGKVRYVYHDEKDGYYRLETVQNPPTLQYIAFDTYPTLIYSAGATLDLSEAVVAAAYSNDMVENVTAECVFIPANGTVLSASDTTLTASYTDGGVTKTVSVPLTVS